jgi:hypothetical protein
MQPTNEKQILRCDNILVSPRGIAETSGRKVVVFVPTEDIERITLKYGRSDHRPLLTLTIGVAFAIVGIIGLVEFIIATRGYRYELGMVAFGLIGGSLIFDTLKQRFFLEVQSKNDTRRLVLSKHANKNGLQEFCVNVRNTYKYDIIDAA